jgi:dienelactone hydrolase
MKKALLSSIILWAAVAGLSAQSPDQVKSEDVQFEHNSCSIQATFTKPIGIGPFPTLLLIPGSGQNNRDGAIPLVGANAECLYPNLAGDTLYPYRDLALQLTQKGYAVLRYDELMISCPQFAGEMSFETVWLPGLSAIDYLKKRADVDTSLLYLLGHSEGSTLIPNLAQKKSGIKGLISLAGPHSRFDDLLNSQLLAIAKKCSPKDTGLMKMQSFQISAFFNSVREKTYTKETPAFGGVSPAAWGNYLAVADDVSAQYKLASKPSLFIGLEKDINVPPSELAAFTDELTTNNYTFLSIPQVMHYLCTLNNPAVHPAIAETIHQWISKTE